MPVDPARVKTLFLAASDLRSPSERATFLDRECGGDGELRARVEALLSAEGRAGPGPHPDATTAPGPTPTEALPWAQAAATETRPGSELPDALGPAEATGPADVQGRDATIDRPSSGAPPARRAGFVPGQVIAGRYTLRKAIGEGGMGTVYLADQTEPVRRQVALKLIRIGMDSRAVLARFDAERQALALMDHNHIARVYDGGTTEANQPFFVMELVKGVPITDYCDRERLPVRARLELFVAVCEAVQHAHQKGIIHRDLKPSNVMVAEVDGRPVPKVIDFGVAKATDFNLTDLSLGDTGAIVGTPTYMSPEQADPSSMDVNTRTDVYALGVILYELLAGSTPLDPSQFRRGALLEMLRMVREVDPPRPSSKVSTADALPNIAANRGIDPAHLKQILRGDLDWIAMKALEKDRDRRYGTANAFAADVLHHLAYEPVLAAPPGRSYRLRKFVRKHRGGVIAASLVVVALLAGVVGTTWQAIRADLARRDAEKAATAEKAAKEQSTKGLELFARMLDGINPRSEVKGGPTVYEVLRERAEKAADQLDQMSVVDPLVTARLMTTLGNVLRELGNPGRELELLKRAEKIRAASLGPEHPDTLTLRSDLGEAYRAAGQPGEAVQLLEPTLATMRARLGPDHPDTLECAHNLMQAYYSSFGINMSVHFRKGLPLGVNTLARRKATLGPNHPSTLQTEAAIAILQSLEGDRPERSPRLERALAGLQAKLGPDHPDTLECMRQLAEALSMDYKFSAAGRDQFARAESLYRQLFTLTTAKFGQDHPTSRQAKFDLAQFELESKRVESVWRFEQLVADSMARFGPEGGDTVTMMIQLSTAYASANRHDEAIRVREQIADIFRKRFGPEDSRTMSYRWAVVQAHSAAGRHDEAVRLGDQLFADLRAKPRPRGSLSPAMMVPVYQAVGRHDEAIRLLKQADVTWRESIESGENTKAWADAILFQLAKAYFVAGQADDGIATAKDVVARGRKAHAAKPDPAMLAHALDMVGKMLRDQRRFADAEPYIREAVALSRGSMRAVWAETGGSLDYGTVLLQLQRYAEAEPYLLQAYQGFKARGNFGKARIPEALDGLIELYTAMGKPDEIKKWQAERAKFPPEAELEKGPK